MRAYDFYPATIRNRSIAPQQLAFHYHGFMADNPRTVFVSDTHGYLDHLIKLLSELGVTDKDGKWIAGDKARICHLGDFVHRGPKSVETLEYLFALQDELDDEQITLHIGNHDGIYLRAPRFDPGTYNPEIPKKIREGFAEGRFRFASVFDDDDGEKWLCVHGGLDPRWDDFNDADIEDVAKVLNRMGTRVVNGERRHPEIIALDDHRGGKDPIPGILWCDVEFNLREMESDMNHRQIVGHHPQEQGVNLSDMKKIWAINAPYGHAQALVHDPGIGFQPSVKIHGPDLKVVEVEGAATPLPNLAGKRRPNSVDDYLDAHLEATDLSQGIESRDNNI